MKTRPQQAPESAPAAKGDAPKKEEGSFLRFLLILALAAWAFRSFVVAPFSIPSGSMLPTLYIGDYLVVAKWPYGYSKVSFPLGIPSFEGRVLGRLPARGDVVVFRHPSADNDVIKRVIGLPGDRVSVSGGAVTLNGKPLARRAIVPVQVPVSPNSPCRARAITAGETTACVTPAFRESLPGGPSYTVLDAVDGSPADEFGEVVVPAGHVFLMGDNRDDSLDSRFPTAVGGMGFVPTEDLIGRAMVTFWSTDGSASWINPVSWFTALRASRIGNGYSDD